MANYPPPPPGGGGWGNAPPPPNPFVNAMTAWLTERKYEFVGQPDIRFYQAWLPFQYLPSFTRVTREVRATFDDARVYVVEAPDDNSIAHAFDNGTCVLAFVQSPRFQARVALRSKRGGGFGSDLERGLDSLFGGKPKTFLGDPALEAQFEVFAPSPQEGNAALPVPLRQRLVSGFKGIVETRNQGMIVQSFACRAFDPSSLDPFMNDVRAMVDSFAAPPADYRSPPPDKWGP
ncbi:MAG: hypothetical protein U0414_43940 [Polyangiaceae bacterium]